MHSADEATERERERRKRERGYTFFFQLAINSPYWKSATIWLVGEIRIRHFAANSHTYSVFLKNSPFRMVLSTLCFCESHVPYASPFTHHLVEDSTFLFLIILLESGKCLEWWRTPMSDTAWMNNAVLQEPTTWNPYGNVLGTQMISKTQKGRIWQRRIVQQFTETKFCSSTKICLYVHSVLTSSFSFESWSEK